MKKEHLKKVNGCIRRLKDKPFVTTLQPIAETLLTLCYSLHADINDYVGDQAAYDKSISLLVNAVDSLIELSDSANKEK